jgi:hypothetical protein
VELSELFREVTDTLRREEKLAGAGRAMAGVPASSAGDESAAAQMRTLPSVAA